jgi:serine/threonine protein kinase
MDCKVLRGNIDTYFENWINVGEGSFGAVYNVSPTARAKTDIGDLPDHVALKLFITRVNRSSLIREIQNLKLINVPHGIKYYGCYESPSYPGHTGEVYIVTDIAPGQDLEKMLANKLSLKHKNAIVKELSKGIAELHSIYIIHRDLKPDNIIVNLLDEDKVELHIIDYGLSCYVRDKSDWSCPRGAPMYRDPKESWSLEPGAESSNIDSKILADWYAFGLICVYIYTDINLWYYANKWSDPKYRQLGSVAKEMIPVEYRSILLKLTDEKLAQSDRPTPMEIIHTFQDQEPAEVDETLEQ